MIPALAALLLAAAPGLAAAKGGAFRESAHGRRDTGVLRVQGVPRGECSHCHGAPRDAGGRREEGHGHVQLFSPNENALCASCHARATGSWLGDQRYDGSAHGSGAGVVWPGPAPRGRDARDAGKCVNCHDPHGVKDARGLVPSLLRVRGTALCLGCHAGNPGADVASALTKTYRHPLVADEPAGSSPGGVPALAAGIPALEASGDGTCDACHNPHAAEPDAGLAPSEASGALSGVVRARVSNGPRGAPAVQTLSDRGDLAPVREFEVCFKCHSTSARRPARTTQVAAALNPANASFHPVEAAGRNRTIDRRAFATGWGPESLVTCSDCHGSDGGGSRGPHGSSFQHILRSRYAAGTVDEPMLETDLCFACHAYRTYGDPAAREEATFSRFARHALHVSKGYSCWSCHEAHGSVERPSLVAVRSPGMIAYAQDASGGSCTVTCHLVTGQAATYRSAYPR